MENREFLTSSQGLMDGIKRQKSLCFGLPFLDEASGGILQQDFVVIGGYTGKGKTELVDIIANANAEKGYKVLAIALEAYEGELTNRRLFNLTKKFYYSLAPLEAVNFRMRPWVRGDYNSPAFIESTKRAKDLIVRSKVDKLIYYKYRSRAGFNVHDFISTMDRARDEIGPDLVIVDHLHFFDRMKGENENEGMRNLCAQMRDYGLLYGIPIVSFAHLRKAERGEQPIVPDIDEIHGSSDLKKQVTMAIIMNQHANGEKLNPYLSNTHFRIGKDRYESGLDRYAFSVKFDLKLGVYRSKYQLSYWNKCGYELKPIESGEAPHWAKNFIHSRI